MVESNSIAVSHANTQHSYRVVYAMQKAGKLSQYYTSFYYKKNKVPFNIFSKINSIDRYLSKRYFDGLDQNKIMNFLTLEILEQLIRKLFGHSQITENFSYYKERIFDKLVSNNIKKSIIISYPNCCLNTFIKVKKNNGICILDMPTLHHLKIAQTIDDELILSPEYSKSLTKISSKHYKRLEQEIELSDFIVVPSDSVKNSLIEFGVPENKVFKINYGSHINQINTYEYKKYIKGEPLKLIFVGQIQQKKGIKYLLEAFLLMKKSNLNVELTIIGKIYDCEEQIKKFEDIVKFRPFIERSELRSVMLENHILIQPSLIEGSSLAIIESMSCGLAIIATENCGADYISNGNNGIIIPIRNSIKIFESVIELYYNEDLLEKLRKNGIKTASNYSWDNYYDFWTTFIDTIK